MWSELHLCKLLGTKRLARVDILDKFYQLSYLQYCILPSVCTLFCREWIVLTRQKSTRPWHAICLSPDISIRLKGKDCGWKSVSSRHSAISLYCGTIPCYLDVSYFSCFFFVGSKIRFVRGSNHDAVLPWCFIYFAFFSSGRKIDLFEVRTMYDDYVGLCKISSTIVVILFVIFDVLVCDSCCHCFFPRALTCSPPLFCNTRK